MVAKGQRLLGDNANDRARSRGLFPALGDHNNYCGPTALAALVGCTVIAAEDATLEHRKTHGKPRRDRMRPGVRVKTMWNSEIVGVVKLLGAQAHELPLQHNPTLAQFLRRHRSANARLLILITGHFIAVRDTQWVDSNHRTPTPLDQCRHMRTRVQRAWLIETTLL